MLALLSVWAGMLSLAVGVLMLCWSASFTDLGVVIGLYSAIFSLTFAGITLWALRKEAKDAVGVLERRRQCYVGIGLSTVGIVVVYVLVALDRRAMDQATASCTVGENRQGFVSDAREHEYPLLTSLQS